MCFPLHKFSSALFMRTFSAHTGNRPLSHQIDDVVHKHLQFGIQNTTFDQLSTKWCFKFTKFDCKPNIDVSFMVAVKNALILGLFFRFCIPECRSHFAYFHLIWICCDVVNRLVDLTWSLILDEFRFQFDCSVKIKRIKNRSTSVNTTFLAGFSKWWCCIQDPDAHHLTVDLPLPDPSPEPAAVFVCLFGEENKSEAFQTKVSNIS